MALRSIEITLPEEKKELIEELLNGRKVDLDIRVQRIIGVWKHPPLGGLGWMMIYLRQRATYELQPLGQNG